jgi:urease accessory protein
MNVPVFTQLVQRQKRQKHLLTIIGLGSLNLFVAMPALAHHAMSGRMPANGLEGFLSGLAHPVIGIDHLAFIVAVGLLAATKRRGIWMAAAFIAAALVGTGLHLISVPLPGVELLISGSVLLFGTLLALPAAPAVPIMSGLAAVAGLLHGYAYGEAIFGAESTPVLAYLLGFSAIQLGISLAALWVARRLLQRPVSDPALPAVPVALPVIRATGLVICGVGIALLSNQIVSAIFPV